MSNTKASRKTAKANSRPVKSRVYVLYTGGTFGMAPDEFTPGHPLRPMELDDLKEALPDSNELAEGTEVTLDRFTHLLDSSSMRPKDWQDIAERIESNYDDHDGFVIIQGTDTLSYTASALSFILENLSKPVIVTGSQLPLHNPRTDALLNYGHALMIAAYNATDLPKIPEVVVVFADKIIRGCRTRKMSASSWTGFDSPNCPPLGEIGEHVRIFESQIRPSPPPGLDLQLNIPLVADVLDISLFPGLRASHLEQILKLDSVRGVVFRTYGTGNAPEDEDFLSALKNGIEEGNKTVVNITQCPQGSVEMGLYAASIGLIDNGVISGLDMTPEAALTKLMVTLGTRIGEQVKLQMQVDQRGEQSQNLFDLGFKSRAMSDENFSDFVVPDRRFDPKALSSAVMRIKAVNFEIEKGTEEPIIDVYMNYPRATCETIFETENRRRIHRIKLQEANHDGTSFINVVENLNQEIIKNALGDSDITLTFVSSPGVKFGFEKLSISMFTQA